MAVRALMRHKLRSALSIVGIVCGVMAVVSMISIGEGARQEALRQIEQLGTCNIYLKAVTLTEEQAYQARRKRSSGLRVNDAALLEKSGASVAAVGCLKEFSASITDTGRSVSPQFIACSAGIAELQNLFVRHGRFIQSSDVEGRSKVCVLGSSLAENLGAKTWLGSYLRIGGHLFKVVGILKRYDYRSPKTSTVSTRNYNEMLFVPLGLEKTIAQPQAGTAGDMPELTEIIVKVRESGQVIGTAAVIGRIMEVAHHGVQDFQMVVPQALLKQAQKTRRMFNIILGSIAGISLLVGGIGIMNIMLATVSERTKEIGIRRAVGATRGHIVLQFLAESVILTLAGGMAGIAAGIGCVCLISMVAGWATAITAIAVCVPLAVAVLVGIFFGLYPAYRAAGMNPIAALRYE